MRIMRKTVSLVLALLLLAGVPVVRAEALNDVTVDNEPQAMHNLMNFGIIEGYEDGSLKPEREVNRAEMAKMLAVSRGYGEPIGETVKTEVFSDVQNHWAGGYISYCSEMEIVEGRGNGFFDPDATVTHQEAAVMMLRTLGYTNETINAGKSDVYNVEAYKAKALSLGLLKQGSQEDPDSAATRGDVSEALNVALDQVLVCTNTQGLAEAVVNSKTGAEVTLGAIVAGESVIMVGQSAYADSIAQANDKSGSGSSGSNKNRTALDKNFYVTLEELNNGHSKDLSSYLYQSLVVYKDYNGKVVYIAMSNSETYSGKISGFNYLDEEKKPLESLPASYEITLDLGNDVSQTVTLPAEREQGAGRIPVYFTGEEVRATYVGLSALIDWSLTVITDDNKVVQGVILSQEQEPETEPVQVTSTYISGTSSFCGITLPQKEGNLDQSCLIIRGDATSLEDIKIGDILETTKHPFGTSLSLLVTRDTVAGTITKVEAKAYYFNDNDSSYRALISLKEGDCGTFYLDSRGRIAAFKEAEEQYGVVVEQGVGSLRIFSDSDSTYKWETGDAFVAGDFVVFRATGSELVSCMEKDVISGIPETVADDNLKLKEKDGFIVKKDVRVYKKDGTVITEANMEDVKSSIPASGEEPEWTANLYLVEDAAQAILLERNHL